MPTTPSQTLPVSVSDFHAITDVDGRLAVELALKLRSVPELLTTYNLTAAALRQKIADPMFRSMIKEARTLWASDLSVKERIRLKTALLVEDSILSVFSMVHDDKLSPQPRIDAFKQLARVAEVDQSDKRAADVGARFTVHIDLGQGRQPVVIDAPGNDDPPPDDA